jgi:phospholipid/cholesterol/gamma-HCH transport system ATP-binding protein
MSSDQAILKINNLVKSFGDNHVHQGVNLRLHRGESIGLLGGSGTGKSTLLRMIIGLDFIDQGEILFHDQRIDKLNEDQLSKYRKQISYSFQSGALFDSQTVFENIAYPLIEHTSLDLFEIQAKVKKVLKLIDLEGKEELMPSDLSGGMQKRVGMARAMILDPEIILYDEPTAGLDPSNTENVLNVMKKLKNLGHASIFVTHDIPAAIAFCDRVMILAEGNIAFNDTIEAFQKSDLPIVEKFFKSKGNIQ